jgi:hypothetical protein
MPDRSAQLIVLGSSLWSATLAATVAAGGIETTYVDTAVRSDAQLGIIRRSAFDARGFAPDRRTATVAHLGAITLTEFDALEATFMSDRLGDTGTQLLCIPRSSIRKSALSGPGLTTIRSRNARMHLDHDRVAGVRTGRDSITVAPVVVATGTESSAAATAVSSGGSFDETSLDLVVEAGWSDCQHPEASWFELGGPILLGGRGALLLSSAGTFLTLRVGLADLTGSGMDSLDLMQSVIDHVRFRDILPRTHPSHNANYPVPAVPRPRAVLQPNGLIDLGSFNPHTALIDIEAEMRWGEEIGRTLRELIAESDLRLVGLSRLGRAAKRQKDRSADLAGVISVSAKTWLETDSDRLFNALFGSA